MKLAHRFEINARWIVQYSYEEYMIMDVYSFLWTCGIQPSLPQYVDARKKCSSSDEFRIDVDDSILANSIVVAKISLLLDPGHFHESSNPVKRSGIRIE